MVHPGKTKIPLTENRLGPDLKCMTRLIVVFVLLLLLTMSNIEASTRIKPNLKLKINKIVDPIIVLHLTAPAMWAGASKGIVQHWQLHEKQHHATQVHGATPLSCSPNI